MLKQKTKCSNFEPLTKKKNYVEITLTFHNDGDNISLFNAMEGLRFLLFLKLNLPFKR